MAFDPILEQRLRERGGVYADYIPKLQTTNPSDVEVKALPADVRSPDIFARGQENISNAVAPIRNAVQGVEATLAKGIDPSLLPQKPQVQNQVEEIVAPGEIVTGVPQMEMTQQRQSQSVPNGYGTLMGAFNDQKKAIQEGTDVGMKQAAEEAAYNKTLYAETEKMRLENERKEVERQRGLDEKMSAVNEKINEFNSMPATVGERFANATTGQKILTGIALFLGAAPNSSGQNKALAAMQASIDSDLAKAKVEVGNANTFYSQMKDKLQDARQADAAARLAYLSNAQLKLNEISSQYKGPALQANAKLLNAKIDQEKGQIQAAFAKELNASRQFEGADQITAQILRAPKEMQNGLLEAKEVYDATNSALKSIDESFATGESLGLNAKIPFSDAKAQIATENAKMESAIRATMKGQGTIQETEITRLVKPFLLGEYDTKTQREIKNRELKKLVMTKNEGQIGRLRSLGIIPKTREEKYKTLKPNK